MKAIAAFFITFFHFKESVPQEFANIFVGGVIGNILFFYCSGYLLKFKEEKFKGEWLVKKIIRLLPSVWVFMLFISICNFFRNNISEIPWFSWIYPTKYWFINAIIAFFLTAYLLKWYLTSDKRIRNWKHILRQRYIYIGAIFILAHIFWFFNFIWRPNKIIMDAQGIECWFYYFLFFLWGFYTKQTETSIKGKWQQALLFPFSIIIFYTYKKSATYLDWLMDLQFIFIPILLVFVTYSARHFAVWIFNKNLPCCIKTAFVCISNLTLDIYIVQVYLMSWLMPKFIFPLNVFILFAVIFICAMANKNVADKIGTFLLKKL